MKPNYTRIASRKLLPTNSKKIQSLVPNCFSLFFFSNL
uniref:Uncharacterized protein n=1 Tax=Rhizophora mucronata TaxID=61149 RepID=A0A2P2N2X6_RHIMU